MRINEPEGAEPGKQKQGRDQAPPIPIPDEEELAEPVDKLCELLSALEKKYNLFKELAEEKQEHLVENDLVALNEVVEKEEKVMKSIEELEDRRSELTDKLAEMTGEDEINVSTILEFISGSRRRRLANLQETLQSLLEDVSRLNDQNRQLLLDAMKFNEFSLKLMMQGAGEDGIYSADGDTVKKDEQQSRNIIDRRA